jgi:hypothetical protein
MQLAREVTGIDFEPQFINVLENAVSNLPVLGNGRDIYTKYVKPAIFDINRVAFQFAITSLIEGKPDESPLTQYEIRCQSYEQAETGNLKLAMGHALFRSKSTRKESTLMYIALHMGDHNCIGGVRSYTSADEFERIKKDVLQAFTKSDLPGMILSLDQHFDLQAYSLWHLFPDGKRKVMYNILHEILQDVECMYSQFFRRFFPFFTAMKELNIPSPMALEFPIQYTLNHELITNLNAELIDITKIQQILDDMKRGGLMPGKKDFSFHAAKAISRLIDSLSKMPENVDQIMLVNRLFSVLEPYSLSLDLWDCQNTYYRIGEHICQSMNKRRRMGDRYADDWVREYQRLGDNLGVRCSFN